MKRTRALTNSLPNCQVHSEHINLVLCSERFDVREQGKQGNFVEILTTCLRGRETPLAFIRKVNDVGMLNCLKGLVFIMHIGVFANYFDERKVGPCSDARITIDEEYLKWMLTITDIRIESCRILKGTTVFCKRALPTTFTTESHITGTSRICKPFGVHRV